MTVPGFIFLIGNWEQKTRPTHLRSLGQRALALIFCISSYPWPFLTVFSHLSTEVGSTATRERPRVVVGSGGLYSNVCVVPEEVRTLGSCLVAYHFCQVSQLRPVRSDI